MSNSPDVVVVGGGAIGASTARALAKSGLQVTVLTGGPIAAEGAAWLASAGMLAAQIEGNPGDPAFELGLAGRNFYRMEGPELEAVTQLAVGLNWTGILRLAGDEAEAGALERQVNAHVDHGLRAEWLTPETISKRWSWLNPKLGGFWAPDDGVIDPKALVAALRLDATRLGARVLPNSGIELLTDGTRSTGIVLDDGSVLEADSVVLAAGAWTAQIGRQPRSCPVSPVKGQMLAAPWPKGREPLTVYSGHNYILPQGDELWIGATEEDCGFDNRCDTSGSEWLLAKAGGISAELGLLSPTRHWSGLRPTTPDGLPIVGPDPELKGLWYATGHGRAGILLAGVTGKLLAESLSSGDALALPRELSPGRF